MGSLGLLLLSTNFVACGLRDILLINFPAVIPPNRLVFANYSSHRPIKLPIYDVPAEGQKTQCKSGK